MRRFVTNYIWDAIAAAYAGGKRPTLEQVTKAVRRAADKNALNGAGQVEPLTLDEWVEVAAFYACQTYGCRQREAVHNDVKLAWLKIVEHVRRNQELIDLRLAQRAEELAEQARADVDEFGTPPLPIGDHT